MKAHHTPPLLDNASQNYKQNYYIDIGKCKRV